MSESLEILNSPQDMSAWSQSPKGRIISEADDSCLSGPLLLGASLFQGVLGAHSRQSPWGLLWGDDPLHAPLPTQTKPSYYYTLPTELLFRLELTEQGIIISLIRDIWTALTASAKIQLWWLRALKKTPIFLCSNPFLTQNTNPLCAFPPEPVPTCSPFRLVKNICKLHLKSSKKTHKSALEKSTFSFCPTSGLVQGAGCTVCLRSRAERASVHLKDVVVPPLLPPLLYLQPSGVTRIKKTTTGLHTPSSRRSWSAQKSFAVLKKKLEEKLVLKHYTAENSVIQRTSIILRDTFKQVLFSICSEAFFHIFKSRKDPPLQKPLLMSGSKQVS